MKQAQPNSIATEAEVEKEAAAAAPRSIYKLKK